MLKRILIFVPVAIAILLALVLIAAAFQPDRFSVERDALLGAPPGALFEQVNDHHNFAKWNPFIEGDPEVRNTYSGPDSGMGAACSWEGGKSGKGTSTITESRPNELVRFRMDWIEPMAGTSTVDFVFKPEGEKTHVTWKMYGAQTFPGKVCSLFLNMEKMCGPMFEKGLVNLEKAAKPTAEEINP